MMSSDDITPKLQKIKMAIETAEREDAQLQGRLQGRYEWMEKEFGIKTLPEAEQRLVFMDDELTNLDADLHTKTEKLEKAYPWGF